MKGKKRKNRRGQSGKEGSGMEKKFRKGNMGAERHTGNEQAKGVTRVNNKDDGLKSGRVGEGRYGRGGR